MALYYGYEDEVEKLEDKVETVENNYLPLSGGQMKGNLDLKLNRLLNVPAPINDTDEFSDIFVSNHITTYINTNLIETLIREYHTENGIFLYKIDRPSSLEISFDSSRRVSTLYDQTLSKANAVQSNNSRKPIVCSNSERINKGHFLKFNGAQTMITDIDLNPSTGQPDICNIFIIYKISSFNAQYWFVNSLCGHSNHGYDKLISFLPAQDIVISYGSDYITIGSTTSGYKSNHKAYYKNIGNCGEINQWICISILWDVENHQNASSLYCNGQLLVNFTSYTSPGSSKMNLGDINENNVSPLNGSIALFLLYKNGIKESDILLHHKCFCNWYKIDLELINL